MLHSNISFNNNCPDVNNPMANVICYMFLSTTDPLALSWPLPCLYLQYCKTLHFTASWKPTFLRVIKMLQFQNTSTWNSHIMASISQGFILANLKALHNSQKQIHHAKWCGFIVNYTSFNPLLFYLITSLGHINEMMTHDTQGNMQYDSYMSNLSHPWIVDSIKWCWLSIC